MTGSFAANRGRKAGYAVGASVLAGSLLFLSACSSDPEPVVTPTTTVTKTPEAEATKSAVPEPEVTVTWPLTGVAVDEATDRPAVAIKIENTNAARPQSGLEDADVVWETIVEFDVSRFVAVFHSKYPSEVGPIRSVRPMDVRIASPLGGVFVYSGGQKGILNLVRKDKGIQALDETSGQSAMWRSKDRFAPHNLYGDISKFAELARESNSSSPQEQFAFAESADQAGAVVDGSGAKNIDLDMSAAAKPSWKWDADSKTWLRSEGTSPAKVASGSQIAATNVVVVKARHFDSGFDAQNNAPVPDYDLDGTGEAIVATGGKTVKAKWSKDGNSSPLTLIDESGEPVLLAPGNTWVELLPDAGASVTVK